MEGALARPHAAAVERNRGHLYKDYDYMTCKSDTIGLLNSRSHASTASLLVSIEPFQWQPSICAR